MHRKRAPEDGMLFVFPDDTTGGSNVDLQKSRFLIAMF